MPPTNNDRVEKIIRDGSGPEVSLPQKLASEAAELLSGKDGSGKRLDSKTMSSIFHDMETQAMNVSGTAAALKPGDFNGIDSIVPARVVTNGSETQIIFGGDDKHSAPLQFKITVTPEANGGERTNVSPVNFSPAGDIEWQHGKDAPQHLYVPNFPQEIDKQDAPDARNKLRMLLSAELTPCTDTTTGKAVESGFSYSLAGTLDNAQKAFGYNQAQMTRFIQDTICPSKFPNGNPSQSPDFVASNKLGIAGYKVKNVDGAIQITNSEGSAAFQWQPKT